MRAIISSCFATLAALGLTGCSSFESRSIEQAGAYDALPDRSQQRLERGRINVGDTPEMVYIAMGNPDEKLDGPNAGGSQVIWIYKSGTQHIGSREPTGWSQVLVPGVVDQNNTVIKEPLTKEIYRTQANADIRVAFAGGVVSSVEQLQR